MEVGRGEVGVDELIMYMRCPHHGMLKPNAVAVVLSRARGRVNVYGTFKGSKFTFTSYLAYLQLRSSHAGVVLNSHCG